jgi:hypothetical protein
VAFTPAPGQVLDRAGEIFAYQHDPEAIGNGKYTVFDDESGGGSGLLPYSRASSHLSGPRGERPIACVSDRGGFVGWGFARRSRS